MKVKYSTTTDNGKELYRITFTNDNWATEESLLHLIDFTDENWVMVTTWEIAGNKEEAMTKAKKFTSYQSCKLNNISVNSQVEALKKLYKEQGIPTYEEYCKTKEAKKTPPVEKEILIKSCK